MRVNLKKMLFVAINAKYPHTNLAVRCLKNVLEKCGQTSSYIEHTINTDEQVVLDDILKNDSDIYGFSCYIWNINHVLNLSAIIKKHRPDAKILLGGPEVSYGGYDLMASNNDIDYIIVGEGEKAIVDFMEYENGSKDISKCASLIYRDKKTIIKNEIQLDGSFSNADFAYDNLDELKNRVIYYESSRGCPFKCGFCLSSLTKSYHEKNLDTVKRDIKTFIDHDLKIVKFVDRTFNANKKRAFEIINYISSINNNTCFHLEIAPSLLDDEFVELLKSTKKHHFQIEIGIQSTHLPTLKEINRQGGFDKFSGYIKQIVNANNVHVHVDLIAGLPHEGLKQFQKSFDDVFSLKSDNLQLGFLKLLKGSPLRDNADKLGIKYEQKAPYEFIRTPDLSVNDVELLDQIEYLLKRFYNCSLYKNTIEYLAYKYKSAFMMFVKLNEFIITSNLNPKKFTESDLKKVLYDFSDNDKIAYEFILYDMLLKRKKPKLVPYLFNEERNDFKNEFYKTNKISNKKHILPVKFNVDIDLFRLENVLIKKEIITIFDYSDYEKGLIIRTISIPIS